jgi:4-amino-4-deoxy-L-arabinose transferase-like glycosyltransferase
MSGENPQRINWLLVGILLVALAFRTLPIIAYNRVTPDSATVLAGDEPGYAGLALGLMRGESFTYPARVPLYPMFIAAVFEITGESYHRLRYVQCLVGLIPVCLSFFIGRRLFGNRAGLISALLVAISFPMCDEPRVVMSENLFTPMLLLISWVTLRAIERPTLISFALIGICIGIADLIRPTLLLYPAFLLLALPLVLPARLAFRCGSVLVLGTLLTILPWTLRNYARYHAVIPLTTTTAAVWQGSPEYDHLLRERGYSRVWKEVLYGPGWMAHDPTSVEGDRYWTERGLRSIRAAPLEYIEISVRRLATFWVGDSAADWAGRPPFSFRALVDAGWTRAQAAQLMLARAIPILGIAAIVVLWRDRKRLATLYFLLLFATFLHSATIAVVRLSEPFQPYLLILIAGAFEYVTKNKPHPDSQPTQP